MTINMIKLNLTNQYNSDIAYERFVFPDGQDHIEIISPLNTQTPVTIIASLRNASDLFILLQAVEILRQEGIEKIHLEIPYLLAARMDRRMKIGGPISLKIIANLINSLNFVKVDIYDPHSEVSLTLIDRSHAMSTTHFIDSILSRIPGQPVLVAPDAGAAKKTEAIAKIFNLDVVYCTKSRSKETGYISKVRIENPEILPHKTCLIVDDICDGGATFIGLAKELKKHTSMKMYLAVSHGIFSKGLEQLSDFEQVYTTNSYKVTRHPKLTTYNLW